MKLFFYCSSSSMLEYFTMNKIVCNRYLERKNRKIMHSLGLINDDYVFVTLRKLKHEKRVFGFEQDIAEIPVTVEISIPDEKRADVPAIALNADGSLSEIIEGIDNNDDALGFFIAGEIPYSYISAILFENEGGRDDIYRPSKDLFFPERLYGIIDDSFAEELNISLITTAAEEISKKYVDIQFADVVSLRNKMSAIILNIILETQEWSYGDKHIGNFDDLTLELLGLSDKADTETEGSYSSLKDFELKDVILADWLNGTENSGGIGVFFSELINQLMKRDLNTFAQAEFDDVIKTIWETGRCDNDTKSALSSRIDQIKGLVYRNSGTGLDNLIESFDDGYKVLQGLVFFLRSPLSALKLADGLTVYKVNTEAKRYAWIMFAALNGMERISSEKTSDEFVMNIAESYALEKFQNQYMINNPSAEKQYERSFILVMEEIVSPEEIRAMLISEAYADKLQNLAKGFFQNKVLSKGFKESDFQKIANPFTELVPNDEYMFVQTADSIVKQINTALKKAKDKAVFDTKAFLDMFIIDQKKFTELYAKDVNFWKAVVYKDRKNI